MADETIHDGGVSIGHAARELGLSVDALRYYERENLLLRPVERTGGGNRRYHPQDLDWLRICSRLREAGMPLAELGRFAELVRAGTGNEVDRLALLAAHRARIEERMATLREAHEIIAWKEEVYSELVREGRSTGVWDPTVGT